MKKLRVIYRICNVEIDRQNTNRKIYLARHHNVNFSNVKIFTGI